MFLAILSLLSSALLGSLAAELSALDDPGSDLAIYVTRPDIRAPLLNVTRYEADEITPGYWFMAPYASLLATSLGKEYTPFQAGPHIYDNKGELVWSGAHLVENRNTFDFRLQTVDDSPAFTFILDAARGVSSNPRGAGMVLDMSYQPIRTVNISGESEGINMHEFNIIHGKTSLTIFDIKEEVDISQLGLRQTKGFIAYNGIREIDLETGNFTFQWMPLEHMSLTETLIQPPSDLGLTKSTWDCFHTNSVDKNEDGDYLISMRYTSTIYKISGADGSIIWRLGGKLSDFTQDFNFSSQHDAKFYSSNSSVTVISFLDNASDEHNRQSPTARTSTVKLVALYTDTVNKTAKILKQFDRPDGGLTKLRGQAQFLPNDGVFAGWSEQGYISEFTPDGRTVLEAKYVGTRFNSYRGYKFDFVGRPSEPIALKTHAYGSQAGLASMSSVFAVSWNGATEVALWNFYGTNNMSTTFQDLGSIPKSGFETTFISEQFWAFSYAEARAANGTSLGVSPVEQIILPNNRIADITAAGLSIDQEQHERKSVLVVSVIVLIGLLFSGSLSMLLFMWQRSKSGSRWGTCFRSSYKTVGSTETAIEEGEMLGLRDYGEETDDESEDGPGEATLVEKNKDGASIVDDKVAA